MKNLANLISMIRIVFTAVLLLLKPFGLTFTVVYILCGVSDILDGFVARKTNTTTRFGEKLDSIADFIFYGVLLLCFYPIILPEKRIVEWILLIAMIRMLSVIIGYIRFKTLTMLHTYANKFTGFVIVLLPLFIPYMELHILVYFCCIIASISELEELLILLTTKEFEANSKSIIKK